MTEPFSIYFDANSKRDSPINSSRGKITNQKLLETIDSVEAFDKVYMVRTMPVERSRIVINGAV